MATLIFLITLVTLILGDTGAAVSQQVSESGVGVGLSLDVETISPKQIGGSFVYSVKFLCGRIRGGTTAESPAAGFPLSPGFYATAINIHNPQTAVAGPLGLTVASTFIGPGLGATFPVVNLATDEAIEFDCNDFAQFPPEPERFAKGFVVIRSNVDINVVAVYTVKNVRCPVPGRPGRVRPCI